MPTYLVTGGCGFIGSHLADILVAAGHHVRILDDLSTGRLENAPKKAKIIVGDVADVELVGRTMKNVDGCFHLAAVATAQGSHEVAAYGINAGGMMRVLEAARTRRVPVVFASSAAVYGNKGSSRFSESCPPAPLTVYGTDMLNSEMLARTAGLVHSIPTIGLRFFDVYGPRQDGRSPYSSVIPTFIERLIEGAGLDIYGSRHQARDFTHVLDAVRFLIGAMQKIRPEPRVFNVCTGRATSIDGVVKMLAHICEIEPTIRFHAARTGDIHRSLGSPEMAALHLGVRARISLDDGLRHTIGSILAHQSAA